MVSDTLDTVDETDMFEDEEAENEVDAILSEITGGKLGNVSEVPVNLPAVEEKPPAVSNPVEEEEDEDAELLNSMRERLRALQN